jgi:2-dehydropantoate 2-reductase
MGIKFDVDLAENAGNILAGLTPEATTSMQRDVAGGGRSEVDGLIHEMVRLGDALYVDVPCYRQISEWAKLKGIQ